MDVLGIYPFRITRNADLSRDEEIAEDLIEMISDELQARRYAAIVRLEVQNDMPPHVRLLLRKELGLNVEDVYDTMDGMVDHSDCADLANLNLPEHKYPAWEPAISEEFKSEDAENPQDIFSMIKQNDILVHHPYESFEASTLQFIKAAAEDSQVIAIKQTIYRTSDESPIIKALVRAAELGKSVQVLIEVKARFDEENNIKWVQMLEKTEVHVTYGVVGLKTHSKVTLVIREEDGGLQTYCHIGTGNYNPETARLYTDLGLFTADQDTGFDIVNLFNALTGRSSEFEQTYKKLMVSPRDMRNAFIALIHSEIDYHDQFGNGHIIAQMNELDDLTLIQELYKASQAGVRIDLIVRSYCRLRAGLPGISENIQVISILGEFLEHRRIYYFHHNEHQKIFIGSADWTRRAFDDRVEVVVEIEATSIKHRLINILSASLNDRRTAWILQQNGRYLLYDPTEEESNSGSQDVQKKMFS